VMREGSCLSHAPFSLITLAYKPLRPHTTKDNEKLKITINPAQPILTISMQSPSIKRYFP